MPNPRRSSPPPLTPDEQDRVLLTTANLLFQKDANGACIDLNSRADIIRGLTAVNIHLFNNSEGRPIFIGKDTIGELVRMCCQTLDVSPRKKVPLSVPEASAILASRYHLKELDVLGQSDAGGATANCIGKLGAAMFHKKLNDHTGSPPVIAIGGGKTMHELMWWLNPPNKAAVIIPTNYATRLSEGEVYDSSYLAMHVHWVCGNSKAKIVSFPPMPTHDNFAAAEWHSFLYNHNQDIQNLYISGEEPDITFLGAGLFDNRSRSISRVYKHLGVDFLALKEMATPPVGDINLCFYDEHGTDLTPRILEDRLTKVSKTGVQKLVNGSFFTNPYCHPFLVGFNIAALKRLVKMGKNVIVVAGGENGSKAGAVLPLLKHEIINGLVTDAETLYGLIELSRTDGTTSSVTGHLTKR